MCLGCSPLYHIAEGARAYDAREGAYDAHEGAYDARGEALLTTHFITAHSLN